MRLSVFFCLFVCLFVSLSALFGKKLDPNLEYMSTHGRQIPCLAAQRAKQKDLKIMNLEVQKIVIGIDIWT